MNRIRASLNLDKLRAIYRGRGNAESWGDCYMYYDDYWHVI
jgi:hypothetical protein